MWIIYIHLYMVSSILVQFCACAPLETTEHAKEGEEAQLRCILDKGDFGKGVKVRWSSRKHSVLTKGKHVIKRIGQISVINPTNEEFTLWIKHVTPEFEDVYTCETQRTVITIVTLKIDARPTVNKTESSSEKISFKENSFAELKCVFNGEPEPEVSWYQGFGNDKIPIGVTGSVLRIPNIPRYATDVYTCRGENSVHYFDHVINVTVTFEPDVEVEKQTVYAHLSSLVVLSCVVKGAPINKIQWIKKGRRRKDPDIDIDSDYRYKVIYKKLDDIPVYVTHLLLLKNTWGIHQLGTYACRASGNLAISEATVELQEIDLYV